MILVTLPVMPFTEQYARETVPREYWHTPEFRSINRRISAAWGGVVAVMAVSHAVAGTFEVPDPGVRLLHRPVDLLFNWIIPGRSCGPPPGTRQKVSGAPDDAPAVPAAADRAPDAGWTR